nr:MAG TPA: hypothetical protein [Caudoviricetes sp.]
MKVHELKELLRKFDDEQHLKALVDLDNEYVLEVSGVSTIEDDDRAFLVIEESLE